MREAADLCEARFLQFRQPKQHIVTDGVQEREDDPAVLHTTDSEGICKAAKHVTLLVFFCFCLFGGAFLPQKSSLS